MQTKKKKGGHELLQIKEEGKYRAKNPCYNERNAAPKGKGFISCLSWESQAEGKRVKTTFCKRGEKRKMANWPCLEGGVPISLKRRGEQRLANP